MFVSVLVQQRRTSGSYNVVSRMMSRSVSRAELVFAASEFQHFGSTFAFDFVSVVCFGFVFVL